MKITKYSNGIAKYNKAQKEWKKLLRDLQTDIQINCQLKMSGVADKLEMKLPTLQYQFRCGTMTEKTLKKLLKIIAEN